MVDVPPGGPELSQSEPTMPPPGYGLPQYPSPPFGAGAQGVAPPSVAGAPYASWGWRVLGWLIDWVLLLVVGTLIEAPLRTSSVASFSYRTTNSATHVVTLHTFSFLGAIAQVVVVILYGGLLCGSQRGQTLGMMAVGVRAIDRDTGQPIGAARGIGRGAFEYLMVVLAFLPWVLDMLWPLWDEQRQTLHDKVSRTVVVRTRAFPAQPYA